MFSTFLTNERVLVYPYRVEIGDSEPQIVFGTELETGGLMKAYMREIAKHKSVLIHSWNGALMLRVQHLRGKKFTMEQDISFPVMQLNDLGKGNKKFLWVRNGMGLTREGDVVHSGTVTAECRLMLKKRPPAPMPT